MEVAGRDFIPPLAWRKYMSDYNYYVPRRQDDPPKVLFWDADEVGVFFLPVMGGMLLDFILGGLVMGVVARQAFLKMKVGRGASYITHLLYWYTPTSKLRHTPPSHVREFIG